VNDYVCNAVELDNVINVNDYVCNAVQLDNVTKQ
jgi:hypothetical protein